MCSMRQSLLFLLITALLSFGITSEAYATNKARAECISTTLATYYPLGYDPALGKYLSDVERDGLAPAVQIEFEAWPSGSKVFVFYTNNYVLSMDGVMPDTNKVEKVAKVLQKKLGIKYAVGS